MPLVSKIVPPPEPLSAPSISTLIFPFARTSVAPVPDRKRRVGEERAAGESKSGGIHAHGCVGAIVVKVAVDKGCISAACFFKNAVIIKIADGDAAVILKIIDTPSPL